MMTIVRKIFRQFKGIFRNRPIRPLRKQYRERVSIARNASFGFRAKLMVYPSKESPILGPNVIISDYCHVGSQTEIHTHAHSRVWIKPFTSVNDNCRILGNVTIERYCLLASNIFISSGAHMAFAEPAMLIRDQDKQFPFAGKPVRIEEDCWIGWGVVIMPGVNVGKGAVIGANAVVTKDVPPYAVYAGSPATKIRDRLTFVPPRKLSWREKDTYPYFYRGFALSRVETTTVEGQDIIAACESCCLVLARPENDQNGIRITGKFFADVTFAKMIVTVNNTAMVTSQFSGGDIDIITPFSTNGPSDSFSMYDSLGLDLKKYTCVCIQMTTNQTSVKKKYSWGISSIELVSL